MAESPAEYVEQLKARVATLEAALRLQIEDREKDRERAREDRSTWQEIAGGLRSALEQIAAVNPDDNIDAIAHCFSSRRIAREALGK